MCVPRALSYTGHLASLVHPPDADALVLGMKGLQGMCLVEQQVVVSSDTEEEASGSDQGTVGQLLPRA